MSKSSTLHIFSAHHFSARSGVPPAETLAGGEGFGEFLGGLVAVFGLLFEALHDDLLEVGGDVADFGRRLDGGRGFGRR